MREGARAHPALDALADDVVLVGDELDELDDLGRVEPGIRDRLGPEQVLGDDRRPGGVARQKDRRDCAGAVTSMNMFG
jgi:hypothetical protein